MASIGITDELHSILDMYENINREKIIRPELGSVSLQDLTPLLDELLRKIRFIFQVAPYVHDTFISPVISIYKDIADLIVDQSQRDETQFVGNRSQFLAQVKLKNESIGQYWPPFVTAAIESRGFLQDEGIEKTYRETINQIREESNKTLEVVRLECQKLLEEANKLAGEIEHRARQTAAHISVKDAQDVFDAARKPLRWQVAIWAGLSTLGILGFLYAAYSFYSTPLFDGEGEFTERLKWALAYKAVLRLVILTVVAAATTFCLKIFRASMHMLHHNLHRQRITNSMAAFVDSAVTPEQRDLILTHLVDAVAEFGCSGLIQKEDDSLHLPKMTIDNITRGFASK